VAGGARRRQARAVVVRVQEGGRYPRIACLFLRRAAPAFAMPRHGVYVVEYTLAFTRVPGGKR